MPQGEVVIDPFTGQSMSREALDALLVPYRRREGLPGSAPLSLALFLQAASPREIIARMLRNLKEIHRSNEDWLRLHAVLQRLVILLPDGLGGAARPRPRGGAARRREGGRRRPVQLPRARAARGRSLRHQRAAARARPRRSVAPALTEPRAAAVAAGAAMRLTTAQRRTLNWARRRGASPLVLLWLLGPVLTPFVIGAVLAYALHPAVEQLARAPRAAPARRDAGRDRRAGRARGARAADRADPVEGAAAAERAAAAPGRAHQPRRHALAGADGRRTSRSIRPTCARSCSSTSTPTGTKASPRRSSRRASAAASSSPSSAT